MRAASVVAVAAKSGVAVGVGSGVACRDWRDGGLGSQGSGHGAGHAFGIGGGSGCQVGCGGGLGGQGGGHGDSETLTVGGGGGRQVGVTVASSWASVLSGVGVTRIRMPTITVGCAVAVVTPLAWTSPSGGCHCGQGGR